MKPGKLPLRCPKCSNEVRRSWTDWVVLPLFVPCLAGCVYWWLDDTSKNVFGLLTLYLPVTAAATVLALVVNGRRCSCGWSGPAEACQRSKDGQAGVSKPD